MNDAWLERVVLALDFESAAEADALLARLDPRPVWVKVGLELFSREGPGALESFRRGGFRVFADLKLHDIPNTVRGAARAVASRGVDLVNVHATGGEAMMRAALEGAGEGSDAGRGGTKVLAVTLLTSLGTADLEALEGVPAGPEALRERVVRLAHLARRTGLHGVVASPGETAAIRKACGPGFLIVTPGIRPGGADPGDQKRIATPEEALRAGSDLLVLGRAITAAKDPAAAWRALGAEIAPLAATKPIHQEGPGPCPV
jgi:orotidine-5'-phosphate decarboxylase